MIDKAGGSPGRGVVSPRSSARVDVVETEIDGVSRWSFVKVIAGVVGCSSHGSLLLLVVVAGVAYTPVFKA